MPSIHKKRLAGGSESQARACLRGEGIRIQVDRIQHVGEIPSSDTVMVRVVIDRDGVVALAKPVSGPPELFNSSVHAVRQFRYRPRTRNGAPVEVDTTIPVSNVEANIKLQ